ncbi:MAG: EscE/YscE/SsaE family type III secretion system needle protein co-chaperone, partial [Oxalobacteraceae bacterium]
MQKQEPEGLVLGLEEWLESDSTGEFAAAIMQRLAEMDARLAIERQKLQSPEVYQQIMAACGAVQAAEQVMRMYIASKN